MIKNIGIAVLLLSDLYTDVQLWACKQAAAQKSDQVLPVGSVIHRRMFKFPQYLGPDKADPEWVHDGPCETTDIGFIDKQRHVHFKGHPTDAQICDVVSRLADSGYLQR
jgi:hypothetical protein